MVMEYNYEKDRQEAIDAGHRALYDLRIIFWMVLLRAGLCRIASIM